jgi:hypothetical protein
MHFTPESRVVPPYAMGAVHQNRDAATAHGLPARPCDRPLQANQRGRLLGFFRSWPNARAMERMNRRPLAHRKRQPLRARHGIFGGCLAHPQESRHRRPPSLLIISYAPMAATTSKMPGGAPPSTSTPLSKPLESKRTEQPCTHTPELRKPLTPRVGRSKKQRLPPIAVSALPITYAAGLDAQRKDQGINSSIRF